MAQAWRGGLAGVVLATVLGAIGPASAGEGNARNGEKVFQACAACHALEPGVHRVGPSLAGAVGRTAGSAEGFRYSKAMKQADFAWTPEKLDAYLADPNGTVPGNRMPFPGLKDPQDRADVIAYLKTQGR